MPKITQQRGGAKATARPKQGNAVDSIKPIQFDDSEGISVCLYGASGSGKTTTWSSFPGKILAIIASGGKRSGELRSVNTKDNKDKIESVVIERSGDIKDILHYQETTQRYNTIVMEHATGLQDLVLREILGIDELPAQMGWGVASQQQWGTVALQMKEILRAILNLSCNRVIVAQERSFNVDEDNELAIPSIGPALSPSVTGWLTPACDYVVQTYKAQRVKVTKITTGKQVKEVQTKIKGVDYRLRTGPDATYMTKFRVPKGTALPDSIVDPSYDKIIDLINGNT